MPSGYPSLEDDSGATKDAKLAVEFWKVTEKVLAENARISVRMWFLVVLFRSVDPDPSSANERIYSR